MEKTISVKVYCKNCLHVEIVESKLVLPSKWTLIRCHYRRVEGPIEGSIFIDQDHDCENYEERNPLSLAAKRYR